MKLTEQRSSMLHGVLLIVLFSCAAFYICDVSFVKSLSFSPMIVGIVLGMLYANSLRNNLPPTWVPGIVFCSKRVLRIGIILYGFRLTFQDVTAVGLSAVCVDAVIVMTTICGGVFIGRILGMERNIALLTSVGSGICGAAAVLGAESAIKAKPYQTAVAVATVVIFGTLAMILYPALYRSGVMDLSPDAMGIFTGSTIHEVAHAVGAGNAMGTDVSNSAIIVKMIRVMMLVPVLLVLGYCVSREAVRGRGTDADVAAGDSRSKISIPWFAVLFLVVIGFNSFGILSPDIVDFINVLDTFLLTMAMTALGAETSIEKFRKAGFKPFLLAFILFVWLVTAGYLMARYLVPLF